MNAIKMAPEELSIDLIDPDPSQPRKRMERLEDLAAAIKVIGVIQPILIREHPTDPNRWMIIIGERRWRAAQLAGLKSIPVFYRGGVEPSMIFYMQIAENLELYRDPLEAHEKSVALKAYVELIGVEAACAQFNRKKDWISRETALAEVSEEVWLVADAQKIHDKRTIVEMNRLCKHTGKSPDEEWRGLQQIGPKTRDALHLRMVASGAKKQRSKKGEDDKRGPEDSTEHDTGADSSAIAGQPIQISPQERPQQQAMPAPGVDHAREPGRFKRKGLANKVKKAGEVLGINSEVDFEAFLEELLKRAVPEVEEINEAVAA